MNKLKQTLINPTQNKSKLTDTLASYNFKSAIFESHASNLSNNSQNLRGFSFNLK